MSEVETHLLASTDGYTTKGHSPGISPEEIRELEQLIHGQPDDPAILEAMATVPTAMVRRFASSGRYAISRILPGRPDSAGRQTIAVCSLVMSSETYAALAAGDLWAVLNSSNLWKIENFSSGRPVRLPDRGAVRRKVLAKDIGFYDAWLRARQQPRGLAITPSLPDSDRAIVDLTQVLSPQERMDYLWGCRLLSPQAPVSIASFVRIDQAHSSRRPVVNITPAVHSDAGRRAIASVGQIQIAVPEPTAFREAARLVDLRLDEAQIALELDRESASSARPFLRPQVSVRRPEAASWWRWAVIGMAGLAVIAAIAAAFLLRKPGKPAELKVERGTDSTITLRWDEASAAATYRIRRWHSTANKPPKDAEGIGEAISVTTPTDQPNRREWTMPEKANPGERWTFQIVAVNWAGMHSEASEPKVLILPLGPPERLEVKSSPGNEPVLRWSKVSGEVRYTVELLDMNTRKILKERSDLENPEWPLGEWQSQVSQHREPLSLRVKARSADDVESEPTEIPWPSSKNAAAPQGSGSSPNSGGDKPPRGDVEDQPPKVAKPFKVENFMWKAEPQNMRLEISWEVDSDPQTQAEVQIQWSDCTDKEVMSQVAPESTRSTGRPFYKICLKDRLSQTLKVSIRPVDGATPSLHPIERERIDGFKAECEGKKVTLIYPALQKLSSEDKGEARVLVSTSKPEDCMSPRDDYMIFPFEEHFDPGPVLQAGNTGVDGSRLWLTIVCPRGLSNTVEIDRPPCPAEPSPPSADTPTTPSDDALSAEMKRAVRNYIKPVKYETSKDVSIATLQAMVSKIDDQIDKFESEVKRWLQTFKNPPPFSKPEGREWIQIRLASLSREVTNQAKEQATASFESSAPPLDQMQVACLVASLQSSLVKVVTEWKDKSDYKTREGLKEEAQKATEVCGDWLRSKFENDLKGDAEDKTPQELLEELRNLKKEQEQAEKKYGSSYKAWEKQRKDNPPVAPNDPGPKLLKTYALLIGSMLNTAPSDLEAVKPEWEEVLKDLAYWSNKWQNPAVKGSAAATARVSGHTLYTLKVLAEYAKRRLPQLTAPAKP